MYSQSNATDEYKISYSNATTCDSILFFGSSRTLHHYVPSIFEKELGLSCYNAADWGIKNIFYHYGQLSNILTRYTPKAIVFEIHPCDWLETPFSGKERAGALAPYCGIAEEYPFPVDQERVALLERFISDCQKNNIQLIIVFSPMYVCSKEDVLKYPRELAAKHHLPFIDHYRDSDFVGHPELFYDFGHLNRKGAEKYSRKLSKELRIE